MCKFSQSIRFAKFLIDKTSGLRMVSLWVRIMCWRRRGCIRVRSIGCMETSLHRSCDIPHLVARQRGHGKTVSPRRGCEKKRESGVVEAVKIFCDGKKIVDKLFHNFSPVQNSTPNVINHYSISNGVPPVDCSIIGKPNMNQKFVV